MKRINIGLALALAIFLDARLLAADTNQVAAIQVKATTHGTNHVSHTGGWYGPGSNGGFGYFNPKRTPEYNPYPYYNILGGEMYGSLYQYDLPDQNESSFNPPAAITRHHGAWSRSGQ